MLSQWAKGLFPCCVRRKPQGGVSSGELKSMSHYAPTFAFFIVAAGTANIPSAIFNGKIITLFIVILTVNLWQFIKMVAAWLPLFLAVWLNHTLREVRGSWQTAPPPLHSWDDDHTLVSAALTWHRGEGRGVGWIIQHGPWREGKGCQPKQRCEGSLTLTPLARRRTSQTLMVHLVTSDTRATEQWPPPWILDCRHSPYFSQQQNLCNCYTLRGTGRKCVT